MPRHKLQQQLVFGHFHQSPTACQQGQLRKGKQKKEEISQRKQLINHQSTHKLKQMGYGKFTYINA